MQSKFKIFLTVVLVFISTFSYAQQESFPFLGEIIIDDTNVRAGQSQNFEALIQLKKGEKVVVMEHSYSWYKIKLPAEAKSYISKNYVTILDNGLGEISGNRVNIRAGLGINFTILGQVREGEHVSILEEFEDWYRIEPAEGTFGWIKEDFVQFSSNSIDAYEATRLANKQEKEKKYLAKKRELDEVKRIEEARLLRETDEQKKKELRKTIFISGMLTLPDSSTGNLFHKVILNNNSIYYVKGESRILDEFENYKVEIEGNLMGEEAQQLDAPLIEITELRLML